MSELKMILTACAVLTFGFSAWANNTTFKSIQCVDATKAPLAPVFINVDGNVPNAAFGIRFTLGNLLTLPTGDIYGNACALGDMDIVSAAGGQLILKGSFAGELDLDLDTGMGSVSGPVNFDPVTGANTGYKLAKYPVFCTVD